MEKGYSITFLLIILILVFASIFIFGWITVPMVLALFFGITLGVYVHDRIRDSKNKLPVTSDPLKEYVENGDDLSSHGISSDGKTCLTCGESLFSIVPGKTVQEEIINFAKKSRAWQENPDAVKGWMHPGLYCPNGCVSVLANY